MTETIATSEQEYVAIAVQLAREPKRRTELRERMWNNRSRTWRDETAVSGLEALLESAVRISPSPNPLPQGEGE